jgi:hypothetical protein
MELTEKQKGRIKGKICPYCGHPTNFVNSKEVYKVDYGMIYLCKPCDAYVGCHKGTANALGRLANKELREYKKEAHKYFDMLWKEFGFKRKEAYIRLSEYLGLPIYYTHIGMFSVDTCKKVIEWSKEMIKDHLKDNLDNFKVESVFKLKDNKINPKDKKEFSKFCKEISI